MIGIDLIPAQPPRGVATFQGDFLSPMVQKLVKEFIARTASQKASLKNKGVGVEAGSEEPVLDQPSYIDRERHASEEVGVKDAGESAASSVDVSFFCSPDFGAFTVLLGFTSLLSLMGMLTADRSF